MATLSELYAQQKALNSQIRLAEEQAAKSGEVVVIDGSTISSTMDFEGELPSPVDTDIVPLIRKDPETDIVSSGEITIAELMDRFGADAEGKISEFNANAAEKLDAYNSNHTQKLSAYDSNAASKESSYNSLSSQAEASIEQSKMDALSDITISKSDALSAISTSKTSAIGDIEEAGNNLNLGLVEDLNNTAQQLQDTLEGSIGDMEAIEGSVSIMLTQIQALKAQIEALSQSKVVAPAMVEGTEIGITLTVYGGNPYLALSQIETVDEEETA